MGRRKFKLGRTVKNAERKSKGKRGVGRPPKQRRSVETDQTQQSKQTTANLTNQTWSEKVLADIELPSSQWVNQFRSDQSIVICKLSTIGTSATTPSAAVTHCVNISSDLSWTLTVHGAQVDGESCDVLSAVPKKLSSTSLDSFLRLLNRCNICPGHPDPQFVQMVESKKGKLLTKDGKNTAAQLDSFSTVSLNGEEYSKTVRTSNCQLLVQDAKCPACIHYRSSLCRIYHRWIQLRSLQRQSSTSRTNLHWLNTPEKARRYTHLRTRLHAKSKEVKRLKDRIAALIEENGLLLESSLHSDFSEIMTQMTDKVHNECADNSFERIFWDQQLQSIKVKDKRQVRWHPAMIKWCLHLKYISSGSYHALRKAGIITLLSERTLRDYTHWMRAGVGFVPEVDKQLIEEADVQDEKDRFIVLCWDEMKVKESLVFNKHTCELVGFTDIGDINNELAKLKQRCDGNSEQRCPGEITSHMLLFMVKGMFSSLEFPYTHFATKGVTADQLYPIFLGSNSCGGLRSECHCV